MKRHISLYFYGVPFVSCRQILLYFRWLFAGEVYRTLCKICSQISSFGWL